MEFLSEVHVLYNALKEHKNERGEDIMKKMNGIDWMALVLLIIGGVNWGLLGIFGFNFIEMLFGGFTAASRVVYALIGLSGLYVAFLPSMVSHDEYMGGKMAKSS